MGVPRQYSHAFRFNGFANSQFTDANSVPHILQLWSAQFILRRCDVSSPRFSVLFDPLFALVQSW